MAQVIITINRREYAISCENGEEIHIMKLGRLLDDRAKSLISALGQINENQLLAMVGLLIADELTELKKAQTPAPIPQTEPTDLTALDNELAADIDSLNEAIKSVATKIKSV
ncbi:MAG: cell division protein ZapA [Alphaproteobacteria bacterium]|nr:cell division protein ZapA [Alphaproteobacteria bacterium]MBO5284878.1 cell division protein ZapA [Alphaproteobacteria bacterium]